MTTPSPLNSEIDLLLKALSSSHLPVDLFEKTSLMITRLRRMAENDSYSAEYERIAQYIDWITNLPWQERTEDTLSLDKVRDLLNEKHHGLQEIKERIIEYLAVLKLKSNQQVSADKAGFFGVRAPVIAFVGLVGTGKTTLARAIARSLNRKFVRIPFGGMESPLDLRGQSRVHPDAEAGLIIKSLRRCRSKNPVLLLDEIDRVSEKNRADIMGVLVELLDPDQNNAFRDHFIDYPFDLSEVLFIATCNNTTNIATAVLDRLELLQMPSYNDEDKIVIGRDYVLPRLLEESGLSPQNLIIDENVWSKIVRPLGFDAGIRTLERTINSLCRQVAKLIVEDKGHSLHLTSDNVEQYLPSW